MKIRISKYRAADILTKDPHRPWSYLAALALCRHLETREKARGEEFNFDAEDVGYGWREYRGAVEAANDLGWFCAEAHADLEQLEHDAMQWLMDHTEVIPFVNGLVVSVEF